MAMKDDSRCLWGRPQMLLQTQKVTVFSRPLELGVLRANLRRAQSSKQSCSLDRNLNFQKLLPFNLTPGETNYENYMCEYER